MPRLADPLMALLRDDTWWPRIRLRAIVPFRWHRRNDEDAFADLRALTADVHAGRVPDPDDALLGCLLSALYPADILETEIMQYLRLPRRPNSCPEYEYFWSGHLVRKSTREQLARLLDELAERYRFTAFGRRAHGLPAFSSAVALESPGPVSSATRGMRWTSSACSAGWDRPRVQATGHTIRTSAGRNRRISGGGSKADPGRGRLCWP